MHHPGLALIIIGVLVALIGAVWMVAPFPWLGNLPGDITIEKGNFHFYFPLATCILLSLLLTVAMWVVRYFSG